MKLDPGKIRVLKFDQESPFDIKQIEDLNPAAIVSFTEQLPSHFQNQIKEKFYFMITEGPEVLIKNPQAKKKVWTDLQKIMVFLKEKFA